MNGRFVYHTATALVDCEWSKWGPWGDLCNATRTRNRTEAEPAMHGGANCTEHTSELKIDDCTDYNDTLSMYEVYYRCMHDPKIKIFLGMDGMLNVSVI